MKKFLTGLALILSTLLFSCNKETIKNDSGHFEDFSTDVNSKARSSFAKALAKALMNVDVRQIIKNHALLKFDHDYDVLFHLVKDEKLSNGMSFIQYLNTFAEVPGEFDKLDETLPLTTIFVPKLPAFSAEKWNLNNQVPIVAVVHSDFDEKTTKSYSAYDQNGKIHQIPANKKPEIPVIVVKNNERLIARKTEVRNQQAGKDNFVFSNSSQSFYFSDDCMNNMKKPATEDLQRIYSMWVNFDNSRTADAYNLGATSQRDYIYYNILNPGDVGPLNLGYAEYLSAIAADPSAQSYISDDWADGAYEFELTVLFYGGNGGIPSVFKPFIVEDDGKLFSTSDRLTGIFSLTTPIKIATWNMQTMGDTWKYVVIEHDDAATHQQTFTITGKLGANFDFDIGYGTTVKYGIGFGVNGEIAVTQTHTITTTTSSDLCGEGIVNFMEPVILDSKYIKMGSGPFPFNALHYGVNEVSTGIMRLYVVPRPLL